MSAKTLSAAEVQDKVLQQFVPEARPRVESFFTNLRKATQTNATFSHAAGLDAAEIAAKEKKWGEGVLQKLAEKAGMKLARMYSYVKFGRCWTTDEFRVESRNPMSNGQLISASVFMKVAELKEERDRTKLLADIRRHCYGVREVTDIVKGSLARAQGGRKRPPNVVNTLAKMDSGLVKLLRDVDVWQDNALSPLANVEEGSPCTPELLKDLETAQEHLVLAQKKFTQLGEQMTEAIEAVQGSIEAAKHGPKRIDTPNGHAKGNGRATPKKTNGTKAKAKGRARAAQAA